MRHLAQITEHEMVATFLKAEITSERFGSEIRALLQRDRRNRKIIDSPNTDNPAENAYRIRLLGDFRGYKQNRDLFESFPEQMSWHRFALSPEELARVRYVDYSYWNEISSGTRLPIEAAKNIRAGIKVFGQSTHDFLRIAHALQRGAAFAELILVGTDPCSELVVLEGQVRLTAYFLAPECLPEELPAIVGFSPDMALWM